MTDFKPVERSTLSQSVAEQIIQMIQDGRLNPGDQLPAERDLLQRLGVGRSTLREALRSLAMVNIVEQRPGSGTFVKEINVSSVIHPGMLNAALQRSLTADLLETRQIIEPQAAALAAQRATAEELDAIQSLLDQCQSALAHGQPDADLSARFHLALAQAAHNDVLVMFIESILGLLQARGAHSHEIPGYEGWELASHQQIVDALRAGDGPLAQRLMADHLDESARRLSE